MTRANNTPITVIGAGSWGTALAMLLANNGNDVRLWGRDAQFMTVIDRQRENSRYLPGIVLPNNLAVHTDLATAIAGVTDILVAIPSHAFKATLTTIHALAPPPFQLSWATKGIEPDTGRLLHEVAQEIFGLTIPLAVMSGPNFAKEVARGLPTAMTIAATDPKFVHDLSLRLHNQTFRVYTCEDLIGVQLGGTIKNVIAIATGISDGFGHGANARSALITRGLAEMMRLGLALGGKQETFMGLTGLGDLVLTCTDNQSRNRRFGLAIGQGKTSAQAQQEIGQVVEGMRNAKEVFYLAQRHNIEMPITEQVYQVLYENISADDAVYNLLARQPKSEFQFD